MKTVELVSISRLSATIFEVKLLVDRDLYNLAIEVQETDDQTIAGVCPPDLFKSIIGPDLRPIRPVFDAVMAFWRAQKLEFAQVSRVGPE